MRLSSHLSSSTCNTGTLEAARVRPAFRRRTASSRPRLFGIETTSGADITEILFDQTACNSRSFEKKSSVHYRDAQMELSQFPCVFWPDGRANTRLTAGLRGDSMPHGTIILLILIIALLGGLRGGGGGPFYGTGYYGGGGLGLVIVILLILLLLGKLRRSGHGFERVGAIRGVDVSE